MGTGEDALRGEIHRHKKEEARSNNKNNQTPKAGFVKHIMHLLNNW
jgi:hypothetical protein